MKNFYFPKFLGVLLALFAGLSVFGQTVYPDYVDGMIWVKLNENAPQVKAASLSGSQVDYRNLPLQQTPFLKDLSRTVSITRIEQPYHHIHEKGLDRVYRISFDDPTQVDYIIGELNQLASVEYAEKIALLKTTFTPNDPDYNPSDAWNLYKINAGTAWDLSLGDADVVVAIVDDAVEITHSDIAPVTWTNPGEIPGNGIDDDGNGYVDDVQGYDVANDDNDPNPDGGAYDHGTHVAGISGAATNNSIGIASIGHGISLMAVKSTNSPSVISNGYDGVIYAVASGAHVINMSWGGSGFSATAQTIIDFAYDNNVVCVAAAGNDNVSSTFYPAGYDHVISVASSAPSDAKSGFSNYGTWIDITAPGSAIWSTVPGNSYGTKSGTSMASPLVAGLAGLMLSMNPGLLPDDIEACLLSTADNIDGANPSYIGELGAGRINAFEALNCISTTLDYPPVADFTADLVTIVEGGSVNFTDLSYYAPDTWNWTFTGGTPSTFTGETPPAITYSTAGVYEVSLTVSNINGSDTETKTAYITVNDLSGCDTITNTIDADPIYTWTWTGEGYIGGHNGYETRRIAERYTGYGPTNVMGATFFFTEGMTSSPSSFIRIKVYNETAGEPGAEVYSQDVSIEEIEANVTGPGAGSFYPTVVTFDSPAAVTTPNFYVGYEMYYITPGDTVNCAMTDNLLGDAGRPNTMFYYFDAGDPLGWGPGWVDMETLTGGGNQWSMHIYPWITDSPPSPVITTTSPVCEGEYMDFDGSASTNTVNWDWAINGTSTPYPTGSSPSVIMNSAGNHWVYMAAYNHCGIYVVDSVEVTVNETPDVAVTSTADTLCPGGSADFVASGAASYVWSPTTGLSCTTCPNPTATPTTTTTYTVTGTIGSCTSDSHVTVEVDDEPPVAEFIMANDTICEGDALDLNGAVSSNASIFAWTFTGADVTSSSSSNPSVTYSSPGTYTINLTVENSCGDSDVTSAEVTVLSALICYASDNNIEHAPTIYGFFDPNNDLIKVIFDQGIKGNVTVDVLSLTGQIVYSESLNETTNGQTLQIPTTNLESAVYILRVSSTEYQYVQKLMLK